MYRIPGIDPCISRSITIIQPSNAARPVHEEDPRHHDEHWLVVSNCLNVFLTSLDGCATTSSTDTASTHSVGAYALEHGCIGKEVGNDDEADLELDPFFYTRGL